MSARLPVSGSRLDRFMPTYDVHEVHSTRVRAQPMEIHRALFEVTSNEVWLLRALMAVRELGARGADGSRPLLEAAQARGFAILADEPGREIVLGVIGRFWHLRQRSIRRIGSPAEFNLRGARLRAGGDELPHRAIGRRRRVPRHDGDARHRDRRARPARLPRLLDRRAPRQRVHPPHVAARVEAPRRRAPPRLRSRARASDGRSIR